MATHFWLLPWLALVIGMATLALGAGAGRAARRLAPPTLPRSFYAVWLAATLLLGLAMVRLGASGADFMAARGIALGASGGWALCALARRRSGAASAAPMFGLGTAVVAAGRLWLTHGEVTGLTALMIGAALAVLCLGVAPALLDPDAEGGGGGAVVGLLYLVCLAGAVLIGFGRASARNQEFWADVPLLLGAAGALASAFAGRTRRPSALGPLAAAILLVLLPLSRVAPSWRPLELLTLGAVVFGLLVRTGRGAGDDRQSSSAGLVLLASGSALAFALWSGYGLALLILGGWLVSGPALLSEDGGRAGRVGMGFAAVLLVYRLATLQNGAAVHASGPGDIWDLFAVSLGALLPLLASEWAANGDGPRGARWPVLLQWVVVLTLPALLLDYIWQPRSVAGVLLGVAVGLLLSGAGGLARLRQEAVIVSGVLLGLMLFQFLPLIGHVAEPTRAVRVALILLGASALILRLTVTGSPARKEDADVTSRPRA